MQPAQTARLFYQLVSLRAASHPDDEALVHSDRSVSYAELWSLALHFSDAVIQAGAGRSDRVALFGDKSIEMVAAMLGVSHAGCLFVPVNPVLKERQVEHILKDCEAKVLVTSADRKRILKASCEPLESLLNCVLFEEVADAGGPAPDHFGSRMIDADAAAILYTSGSTGRPKGVVVSHRNLVSGAEIVAGYLHNNRHDRLLSVLPLSFDAGLSQLTTAWWVGAAVVLTDSRSPEEILSMLDFEQVTAMTAVPPIWIQLSQLKWPESITRKLRYIANTGGKMPEAVLRRLQVNAPQTSVYLMYGLTEAFRATYLPPEQINIRPGSIGKAIPNQDVLVLRPDGSECGPMEHGEIVQRGSLVAMGYWRDRERTVKRFRSLPDGIVVSDVSGETCVFSGDIGYKDDEGFIYFVGRNDEMIKTNGYRVSPVELEEIVYHMAPDLEACAFGVEHPEFGQSITLVVSAGRSLDGFSEAQIRSHFSTIAPSYMMPNALILTDQAFPRNQTGKLDRVQIRSLFGS
ncbi:acyl-CoA ligase (AMP-forming), exosortase A system-associated [Cupriavidus oxalaticus]|uniref:Acyl-CoA ligase (AMP-forming), exosortase A system-associated n=2 Tax=Cupriavidus oxalaticus TaxID=96344 RepID=A0A5P3VSR4_9BURK|nr:acyl-CoA ligase (AMP-forming), exosortase A system-associated [Cupriavidus oxalaticus]